MENLSPIIRLKSGHIEFKENLKLDFLVGFVYDKDGAYFLELHFDEFIDLHSFYQENRNAFYERDYKLMCTTDDGAKFTAPSIAMKNLPFRKSMGNFYCFDYYQIEKELSDWGDGELNEQNTMHYVKLEGLRMHHNSHTFITADGGGKKKSNSVGENSLWDHTSVEFQVDYMCYDIIFRDTDDGEVVIEFQGESNNMSFDLWNEIKLDFLEFLSFLNGAPVHVRAEYAGQYYTGNKLDSQFKRFFSFTKRTPKSWNKFIPINDGWYKGDRPLNKAFIQNFMKYMEVNKILDLNTIIFYLNNAEQASSIGERLFIQTILLERFSDKYAETLPDEPLKIVDEKVFEPILSELNKVLEKNKRTLDDSYNLIRSRINNINNAKRQQTDVKFRNLIKGAGIEITDEIDELLLDRHIIIHKGELGNKKRGLRNFHLMDKLIRKIILGLIGYNGVTIETNKHLAPPEVKS